MSPTIDRSMLPSLARMLTILGHVLVLLLGALDALVTAWLGVPPIFPAARRGMAHLVRAVRDRMAGVVEAEIVNDTGRKAWL